MKTGSGTRIMNTRVVIPGRYGVTTCTILRHCCSGINHQMKKTFLSIFCAIGFLASLHAQEKLYANEFPLRDVALRDQSFQTARDLNIKNLLQYQVDRLLAGYRKEAGLAPKDSSYSNWAGL